MSEKLIDRITATVGRRGFLGTFSAATAAFVVGFFRIQGAKAGVGINPDCVAGLFPVGCCCLALDPRSCTYGGCACEWVWKCITSTFGPETPTNDPSAGHQPEHEDRVKPFLPIEPTACRRYSCWECYSGPGTSGESCTCTGGITCSKATFTTIVCAGVGGL